MTHIYLAAPFDRKEEIKGYRDHLQNIGFNVTSRWLDSEGALNDAETDHYRSICASVDLLDIDRAQILMQWTNGAIGTGGRHVELGYAIARSKRVIVIGEAENVFHYHPTVELSPSFEQAVSLLLHKRKTHAIH